MRQPRFKKKVVAIALLISIGMGLVGEVHQAHAFAAITFSPKEFAEMLKAKAKQAWKDRYKILARVAMRILAAKIREALINHNGKPTFVTNWRNYQRKNQDLGGIIARQIIGESARGVDDDPATAVMCEFLRESVSVEFRSKRASQEFAAVSRAFRIDSNSTYKSLSKCSIPTKILVDGVEQDFDINQFRNNFTGGWAVAEKLAQPNNNRFGIEKLTKEEIAKQKKAQEQAALRDAIAGNGFVSITNANGQIKSPAKILQDTASNLIDKQLQCLETADSFKLLAECAKAVILKQITNFRNIADDVGLLDDESNNNGEDGDPTEADPLANNSAVCQEMATDSAKQYCEPTILNEMSDLDGQPIETIERLVAAKKEAQTRASTECVQPGGTTCQFILDKIVSYDRAAGRVNTCIEEKRVTFSKEMDDCTPIGPPTPAPGQ